MPELSNIETYERIEAGDFRPALERFARVLKSIGLWNSGIGSAFQRSEWREEEGYVDLGLTQLGYHTSGLSQVQIRPLVSVYRTGVNHGVIEYWMQCALLIEAAELRDFHTGAFHPYTYELVKALAKALFGEFSGSGVCFTDEWQEGRAFGSFIQGDEKHLWAFDYALLPLAQEPIYANVPHTHSLTKHPGFLEAWYTDRWKEGAKYRF